MRALRLCVLVLLAAVCLPGQELLWRLEGQGGVLGRGRELYRLGDVNGDGWEDMIEWGEVADAASPAGRRNALFVTSSQNGAVLSASPALATWFASFRVWSLTGVGDMNQDGVPDYAVTVYDSSLPQFPIWIEVRNSLTHAVLWTQTIPNAQSYSYGWSIGGDMDVNGDGLRDIVVGVPQLSPGGTIIVYGNNGAELYRIIDPLPNVRIGVDLQPLHGDLDGDGCDDFLCAGPDWLGRGAVIVFSGQTGAVLRESYGDQAGDALSFATPCGDMDGDGVPDYAGGGFWGASAVTAFSGATGLRIHTWRLPTPYMGGNLMGGFDVDQDGVNDIVAGQDQESCNVLSGRDGTFLRRYFDSVPGVSTAGIGMAQVLLAPPPGEQYPLFVYSEREWLNNTTNPPINNLIPGLLWCYRGSPDGVRGYGAADASAGMPLPRSGVRDVDGPGVRFTLSSAPPSMPALLLLGTSSTTYGGVPLPAPLDALGMPGMTLLTAADVVGFAWTGATGMQRGYAALEPNVPPGMGLHANGTALFAQWLWFDPFDLSQGGSTRGQRFRVQ